MRGNCLAFAQFRAEMYRLGWTAPQLFGVHPDNGTLRVGYCGVLIVNNWPVVGVEDAQIMLGRFSTYRTKPGQVSGPPIWELSARGGRI